MKLKTNIYTYVVGLLIFILPFNLVSQITSDVTAGCVPLAVNFSGPNGQSDYLWDFGNSTGGNTQNAQAFYNTPGNYTVNLRETVGGPIIDSREINVYAKPDIAIDIAEPKGCPTHTTTISDASTIDPNIPITNYFWVFGDTRFDNTTTGSTSHSYSLGTYNVSLELTTPFPTCNVGAETSPVQIEVIPAPVASFTTDPIALSSCEPPLEVNLTNTSTGETDENLNFSWDFGALGNSSATDPSTLNYTQEGNFVIRLVTEYEFGCSRATQKTVSIGGGNADITFFSDDTLCSYQTSNLRSQTTGSAYQWFENDILVSTARSYIKDWTDQTPGIKNIELIWTSPDGECSDTVNTQFLVDDLSLTLEADKDYLCNEEDVIFTSESNQTNLVYLWNPLINVERFDGVFDTLLSFDQGSERTIFMENPPVHEEFGVNSKFYRITSLAAINSLGCITEESEATAIAKPNAKFSTNIARGCAPVSLSLTDESAPTDCAPINTWTYDFGDGNTQVITDPSQSVINHTYSEDGIYDVILTIEDDSNCVDTSFSIQVLVGDQTSISPTFTVSKTDFCWNEDVTFTNTTVTDLDYDFRFYVGDAGYSDENFEECNTDQVTHVFNKTRGIQTVGIEIDYNGCFYTEELATPINIKGAEAVADFMGDCATPLTYDFMNNSVNGTTYNWLINDISVSTLENYSHDFTLSGDYNVKLVADNADGCLPHEDETEIKVRQIESVPQINTTSFCINTPYTFNAASSIDETSRCHDAYTWIFDDGRRPYTTGSPLVDFSFNFENDTTKTKEVKLAVKDINGCIDTSSVTFKVFDIRPSLRLSDNSFCLPDTITFTDESTSDTTIVSWTHFQENNVDTTGNSETFGEYDVVFNGEPTSSFKTTTLILTDAIGCMDTVTSNYRIYAPVSNFSSANICNGDSVTFTAQDFTSEGSSLDYFWDFGNGNTSTAQSNTIKYEPNVDTAYNVKLFVVEKGTGCEATDTLSKPINVQTYPEAGFFTDKDDASQCAEFAFIATDSSVGSNITSRFWDFGDGEANSTSSVIEPAYSYKKSGSFDLTYWVQTSFGCRDSTIRTFNIIKPSAVFQRINGTGPVCQSQDVFFDVSELEDVERFEINFGDGKFDSTQSLTTSHAFDFYPQTGKFLVNLVLTGEDEGCENTITREVEIIEVIADFEINNGDTVICFEESEYLLSDLSVNADNYSWDFDNGETSNTSGNQTTVFNEPKTHFIELAISNSATSCRDTIVKEFTMYKLPILTALNDTVCEGSDSLVLIIDQVDTTYSYSWMNYNNTLVTTDTVLSINPAVTTEEFIVTAVDTNLCVNKDTVTAFVIEELGFGDWDTLIVVGDQAKLPINGSNLRNFIWSTDTLLSCNQCDYPYSSTLEDIFYSVDITNDFGCPSEEATFDIKVRPETFVRLPTTFSPNGDDVNDIVFVKGWGIKELISFEIYNRWGERIFMTSDIEEGWDGKYKDITQNSDAYVYKVSVLDWRDKTIESEGYINLIH